MRVYLVIMDETDEALVALRFAARRAAKTNGAVHIIAHVPQQAFNAFGGIQATIEAAGSILHESGKMPTITVRVGDSVKVVQGYLAEHPEVAALVLGAAPQGNPGPLVTHFTAAAGSMPCPVFVVPGGLSQEDLERLS